MILAHVPFAVGRDGIQTPVDEHAKLILIPNLHTRRMLLRRFRITQGRGRWRWCSLGVQACSHRSDKD
jgi:hypothetical protein